MNDNTLTLALTPHAVACATCKVEPGADCVTPTGKPAAKFHVERVRAFEAYDAQEAEAEEPAEDEPVEDEEPVEVSPLVAVVRAHAEEFQHQNGWDIMVETMTDEDIDKIIGNSRSKKGAIDKGRKFCKRLDAARKEVEAEADAG